MNRLLGCLFVIISMDLSAEWEYQGDVALGSVFTSNLYLADTSIQTGSGAGVLGNLKVEKKSDKYTFQSSLQLDLKQYGENANQTNHDLNLLFNYNPLGRFGAGAFVNNYSNFSPAVGLADPDALNLLSTKIGFDSFWKISDKHKLSLIYSIDSRALDDSDYVVYSDSNHTKAEFNYKYNFLPKTSMVAGIRQGDNVFPNGKSILTGTPSTEEYKYDSTYEAGFLGIEGKLTEYTSLYAELSIVNLDYEADSDFGEPIFNLKFIDQISPKDVVVAGYDYYVEDSLYTNWSLTQRMYISYSTLIRDTFAFYMELAYSYINYSTPFDRQDQRLAGNLILDYVFSPRWSVRTMIDFDYLISDAYDSADSTFDAAASYENFGAGLMLRMTY
ncbi:MAG: hypothetical protein AB8E15_11020 [Bdellovibrionales bacterium]